MALVAVFWLIEAFLFVILFIILQVYTNMLYMLQEEWRPVMKLANKDRRDMVIYREAQKLQLTQDPLRGLTEGEIRRQKALTAKKLIAHGRQVSQLGKASDSQSLIGGSRLPSFVGGN